MTKARDDARMSSFSKETLKEIEDARTRLEAWRDTFETYPYLPLEPQPTVVPEIHYIPVETELTQANTARQMRQIRGELAFIRNKFNELSQRKTHFKKDTSYSYIYNNIEEEKPQA